MTLAEGNPASPIRVVFYEDLQCGDCDSFRRMLDTKLLADFGALAAFEHRDFPLPKHNWARPAAIAARYFSAVDAKLGVEFRRQTLAKRRQIFVETLPGHIALFAHAHGLDPGSAGADNPAFAAAVEADYQEGVARGVVKTPTVFVHDGAPFIEIFTLEEIANAIEKALQR